MALVWRGEQLVRKVERAEVDAVNAVMGLAIMDAKAEHGQQSAARDLKGDVFNITGPTAERRFRNVSSELVRSTRILQGAKAIAEGVAGLWGSIGLAYANRIERGFQGKDKRGRNVKARAFPFLRPAANKTYPLLVGILRREIERGS